MSKFLLALIFALTVVIADEGDKYTLGEGVKIPDIPLYVGGYISTDYTYFNEQKHNRYSIDDIAFLAYGNINKFSYLAELEYKEFYVKEWGTADSSQKHTELLVERIFATYNIDDNYKVELGKFNSPIGFWNLTPINVLRETSSKPQSSVLLFPKYTTGINLEYTHFLDYEVKINLLLQENNDLDDKYNNFDIDALYAFGLEYGRSDFHVRIDGGYFHSKQALLQCRDISYLLTSFKLDREKYQLMGEIGTQFFRDKMIVPHAGYLQGVYRLSEKHALISRLESYERYELFGDKENRIQDAIAIFGYTYRPLYPVAFKAEYQFHSQEDQERALFSFSVLF
ncbi:MAG: hypothetical protein J7J31_05660 [Helicobacteraceae bacterium]|nr:hypothetical protein [Helicobacteraceae bacterium]